MGLLDGLTGGAAGAIGGRLAGEAPKHAKSFLHGGPVPLPWMLAGGVGLLALFRIVTAKRAGGNVAAVGTAYDPMATYGQSMGNQADQTAALNEQIQGLLAQLASSQAQAPPVVPPGVPPSSTPPTPPPSQPAILGHQVVGHWPAWDGSLSGIAQHWYGNAGLWRTIYAANRALIGPNPDLIHPGMNLVIPRA